ncbi:MAG: YggT family protein [Boseongicola sp.]
MDGAVCSILKIISLLLDVAFFVMVVHIIMSWLINFQVLNLRQPLVAQIWDGLTRLLEPVYRPIRRYMPNTGSLDLAPLVLFIGIIILRDIVIVDAAQSVCFR